jgi:hypothetical protein
MNLTILSISLLFNVIILRFGRLLNIKVLFSKYYVKTAIIEIDGKRYEFPVVEGSENEEAIDIKKLRVNWGITLTQGIKNSGSCTSKITFLDGELGILRYRGYSIEELADKADF